MTETMKLSTATCGYSHLVNLTPHMVNVRVEGGHGLGGWELDIPASGQVARCEETRETIKSESVYTDLPVSRIAYGTVTGLPEPEESVVYVVSALVAQQVTHRTDVVIPGPAIRDNSGRIVGCEGLCVVSSSADQKLAAIAALLKSRGVENVDSGDSWGFASDIESILQTGAPVDWTKRMARPIEVVVKDAE